MKIITGHTGVAHVTSDDAASYNRHIFGSDKDVILADVGDEFATQPLTEPNKITIGTGDLIMDGVHARITTPETVTIENGTQGAVRNDLIVARYTKVGNIENVSLVVIKGTAGSSADPEYNHGRVSNGETRDAVLYRVLLHGNNIQGIKKMMPTNKCIVEKDDVLNVNKIKLNNGYQMPIVQAGAASGSSVAQTTGICVGTINITFPRAYTSKPYIVASPTSKIYNILTSFSVSATSTGAEITFTSSREIPATFNWVAVGTDLE